MFVILCYDVAAKRDKRVRKVLLKYLRPVQRSVMDGFLTESSLKKLHIELQACIDTEYDTVPIYRIRYDNSFSIEKIGVIEKESSSFL